MSTPYIREGSGYGWRARVGLVIPSIGVTDACEFARIAPRGVISVDTLVRSEYDDAEALTDEFVNSMVENLSPAFAKLTDAGVDVIAQCGTPFVFVNGPGFGDELRERLAAETGTPTVLMATAVRDALRRFAVDSVALCTYYTDAFNRQYADYLEAAGFDVAGYHDLSPELIGVDSMSEVPPLELAELPLDATYRAARRSVEANPDAEALVISGGNLPSIELVEVLETDLGMPVTTSNQATFWKALRVSGVADELSDWGSLLRMDLGEVGH